jgi:hypothetical protein
MSRAPGSLAESPTSRSVTATVSCPIRTHRRDGIAARPAIRAPKRMNIASSALLAVIPGQAGGPLSDLVGGNVSERFETVAA